MATQNINIGVNVSDNGTAKKVVKNFEEITQAATQAQKAAQNINASGGTAGSRGVAAKAAPSGSQNMSNQDYGSARGSAGLTGASARDFAAQSQGLGGLVRLYATYAANVFAVSAAFSALKSAMDTTNMVAGLDQLGAATGTNLGSLSKRLVTLTDGAISFRDAMDAVAKTSSSGMTSKDIERLAVVAKNASLALGVSMPDAINRLSRGISKLEPELLDELGIFTKIDPAVQAYARSVGKAASQLTDFERRQAFANAVLLEGESKFGELATAAVNPYDRLLATLKNVSQEALEVVNKVLGPIVSLLASSPTALAGALAVIGTLLVRQAIPALTEFKAGLAAAADTAAQVAKRRADDAISARKAQYDAIESIIEKEADLQIDKADQVAAKLQAARAKSGIRAGGAAMELIDTAPQLRTKEMYAAARAEAVLVDEEMKAADKRTRAGKRTAAQRLEEKNAILATIAAAEKQQQVEETLQAKKDTRRKELGKEPGSLTPLGLTLEASAVAQDAATKKGIISNAAYNASLIGLKGSFVLLEAEIVKAGLVLSAFDLKVLKARAGIAMFIGVLGTLGGAINKALGALAIITTVLGVFDTIFSSSSKEMDKLSGSLDKIDEAAANASRTLEFLNKKGGYASATIQGISSMANALNELNAAAEETVTSAKAAQRAMGGYDAAKDYVKSLFGGGIENNLADSLAKNLRASLDILATSGIDKEAAETFKKILNVDSLDTETARDAILKLSDAAKGDLVKALSESNTSLNNSASRLQSFKSATENTTKAFQDFIQSTASNNPIFKLGTSLETLGKTMSDVMTGGVKEMEAAMLELANSPEKGVLFGEGFTSKLVEIREEFLSQSQAVTVYQNRLNDLNKELEATRAIATKPLPTEGWQIPALLKQNRAKDRVKQLESDIGALQKNTDALPMDKIKQARDLFSKGVDNAFEKGAELIQKGLGQAADKAAQTIAKAKLGGLSGEARALEETRLAKQDIQIQMNAIQTNIDLILSTERLRASIDESSAIQNLAIAKTEKKSQDTIGKLQIEATVATAYKKLLGDRAAPDLTGDVATRAGLTPGTREASQLQLKTMAVRNSLGSQAASLTEARGSMAAAGITGERARRTGKLEDEQKILDLTAAIGQANLNLKNTLSSISGVMSDQVVLAQDKIEQQTIEKRQAQERKTIEAAIQNAGSDALQKTNLLAQQTKILEKQGLEVSLQALQTRQKLLQVEIDSIAKRYELTRSNAELEKTIAQSNLDVRSQELTSYGALYGLSKDYLINQQAIIDKEKALLDTTTAMQAAEDAFGQKREEAGKRIAALRSSKDPSAVEDERKITEELDRQEKLKNNTVAGLDVQLKSRNKILDITTSIALEQEKINRALLQINRSYELQRSNAETQQTIAQGNLDIKSQELNSANSLYQLSEDYLINQQFLLDKEKSRLDTQKAIDAATSEQNKKREEAEISIINYQKIINDENEKDLAKKDSAKKALADINAELQYSGQLTDENITRILEEARVRSVILGIVSQTALQQAQYNALLKDAEGISKNLTTIFGEMGTALGGAVKAFGDLAVTSDKNAKAQERLNKELKDAKAGPDRKKEAVAQGALDKQKREGLKAELDGISSVAGETKKMFKEKTGAFKVLAAVEKATAIASMALKMQDFATTITTLPAKIAGGVAQLFQQGGFAGFVGAGAFLALMASLGAKSGGSGASTPAFSMNSEQIQETQGTGTTYNSAGEKVSDIGGILGDDSAKANSVVRSLEILKNNSFESLDYDNKLLRSFENVALAIGKATNTVLTSGLRSVNPELAASLGSKTMGGSDIPVIGKLISSIFGGSRSETRNITSQRLELSGTFSAVANDIGSGLRQVTDVLVTWTKKGGWFSKDKSGSYVQQLVGEVPEDINDAFRDIFQSFKQGYQDIAEMMGMGESGALTFVTDRLDTVELKTKTGEPLKFDYTGLKGDEVKAELEAYFSKINNIALKALFPEFSAFETAGEDYGTTVVRVLQNTKQVELALVSIGNSSASAMKGLSGFTAADDLVKISGGIEAFVDSTKFFASNFLTEAERAVPVQAAVVKQLEDLGYSNIKTKDQFKSLIQSLNLTDAASQKTYRSLLELAPGFIDTLKVIEDSFAETKSKLKETATAFSDFAKNIKTFREGLILGAQSISTPSEKFAEARTQFDALYASALGGDKDAMGKLTGSASTLLDLGKTLYASGSEYTSLFNSISTRLADAEISAMASEDVAQLQLDALNSSESILKSIDTNIALIANVPAKAAGGLARGMTLVGEMGPELVDFSYPGRVYTADQTAGMFSPVTRGLPTAEIISELKQLKQELAQLRKDQQKQTGDLIISNYDAHSKSSEEIATAIVTTGEDTMWTERSKSEIK